MLQVESRTVVRQLLPIVRQFRMAVRQFIDLCRQLSDFETKLLVAFRQLPTVVVGGSLFTDNLRKFTPKVGMGFDQL